MESMESDIQERPPEDNSSKMNGLLRLGKKILVTSVVLSSAPVVLPPLVVCSTIGLAVSVPFGLLLASCACTEKLMSKLLPWPAPPQPILGDENLFIYEETEYDPGVGGGDLYMVSGEEEFDDDTKRTVDVRIELVREADEELGRAFVLQKEIHIDEDELESVGVDESMEEEGYGNFLKDEEKPLEEIDLGMQGMGGLENGKDFEESRNEPLKTEVIKGDKKDVNNVEEERIIGIEREVVDEMKGEENVGNAVVVNEQQMKEIPPLEGEGDGKILSNFGKLEKPFEDKNVDDNVKWERHVEEMDRAVQEGEDKKILEEKRDEGNLSTIPKELKPVTKRLGMLAGSRDKEITDVIAGEVIHIEGENVNLTERRLVGILGGLAEDETKQVVDKKDVMKEGAAGDSTITDISEHQLEMRKQKEQQSEANAREIAHKSGLDLLDKENAADEALKGEKGACLEIPVSIDMTKPKHTETAAEKNITTPSKEASLYSEDKIWEHLRAMRMIVGYKATPHTTCAKELKALFMFTGVEPPATLEGHADLAEVGDKLRFLMSIVGVK